MHRQTDSRTGRIWRDDALVGAYLQHGGNDAILLFFRQVRAHRQTHYALASGDAVGTIIGRTKLCVCGLVVRGTIAELYGEAVAAAIRIQYGGSANEKNIGELMAMPDIDGALIGGASLKVDAFSEMVRITAEQW